MKKKQFVVICGIDGSGKSTLIEALKNTPNDWDFTDWKKFENVIDKSYDRSGITTPHFIEELSSFTRSALFLYIFGLQLDKIILPSLNHDRTVISDSYWYKFTAKMAITKHGNEILLNSCTDLPKPNKIIFLDTLPETAKSRKQSFNFYETNGNVDNFINYQTEIRTKILDYISFSQNILVLDDNLNFENKVKASIDFITQD